MHDGTAHVKPADDATSATSGANGIPGYRETYVYTVWMEDPRQNSVFAYCRTLDLTKANDVAGLIKGVVTRDKLIGDFRRHERLPQAGGTVS